MSALAHVRGLLVTAPSWLVCAACTCSPEASDDAPAASAVPVPVPSTAPRLLYLPDGSAAGTAASALEAAPGAPLAIPTRCPPEMVDVGGAFCIDRFEASLVDARTRRKLSPYYHPTPGQTRASFKHWERARSEMGSTRARAMPLPAPPSWQVSDDFEPLAVSERGVVPNGYLSRDSAERACRNAGKRLCTSDEWVTACRGHQRRKFPYGDEYVFGACNVYGASHPALVLHGDPSIGHLDPRLNQVEVDGEPLLRTTGRTASCRSEWGADAAYDMVGNLDEWIDDPSGVFVGGFYARNTAEGCDARVGVHPPEYFDYSLGVRCCRSW